MDAINLPYVIGLDGGGSKTDGLALSLDGTVLARGRAPTSQPQTVGVVHARDVVSALVTSLMETVGGRLVGVSAFLSGLDFPQEVEAFRASLAETNWANTVPVVLDNDMMALLRTGTDEANAVAVVCGTGINCMGRRADGATARFPAIGTISGDWGGGSGLGEEAMWHSARAFDGRGPMTRLMDRIPAHFGLSDMGCVIEALHFGRLPMAKLPTIAPIVFAAADDGDEIARMLVDRLADEIATLAAVAITRLDLTHVALPVVIGGGIAAAQNPSFLARIDAALSERVPHALRRVTSVRPIVGAGLLALEGVGVAAPIVARARERLLSLLTNEDDVPVTAVTTWPVLSGECRD